MPKPSEQLSKRNNGGKIVVVLNTFLDEITWLAEQMIGFIAALGPS